MMTDRDWLDMALKWAAQSCDPATRVGAVIATAMDERGDHAVAAGYNRFPYTVRTLPHRLIDREVKLRFMLHAERVAMLNALKNGVRLIDCTLYLAATDDTGEIWGGPPCANCMIELVEAGLRNVVSFPQKKITKWGADLALSREIMTEAAVRFREVPV
jgi:deoxycytidylate deaminase